MAKGGARPGAGRPKKGMELSLRERRFVDFYVKDLNGAKAAAAAGYAAGSARVTACRLLTRANIRSAIQKRTEEIGRKAGISADMVIEELRRLAFSDMRAVMSWTGNTITLKDSAELDEATASAIAGISQGAKGELRVKLHDKRAALVDLGKHLGLFRADAGDGDGLVVEIRRLGTPSKDGGGDDVD